MNPPERLTGWAGLIDWLNRFRDWAIQDRVIESETFDLHQTSSGRQGLPKPTPATAAGAALHPFKLINASNADDGARVRVVYGTVSNIVPTGMTAGDLPVFYIDSLVTGPIYLVIPSTDWGDIGTVTIANAASLPADEFDWETGEGTTHVEIGSVTVTDGLVASIAQNLQGSIIFIMVGATPDWGPAS